MVDKAGMTIEEATDPDIFRAGMCSDPDASNR